MCGKVKGREYDAECKGLLHQYQLSSQAIQHFLGLDSFVKVHSLSSLTIFNLGI
jgi:hypothetical protein